MSSVEFVDFSGLLYFDLCFSFVIFLALLFHHSPVKTCFSLGQLRVLSGGRSGSAIPNLSSAPPPSSPVPPLTGHVTVQDLFQYRIFSCFKNGSGSACNRVDEGSGGGLLTPPAPVPPLTVQDLFNIVHLRVLLSSGRSGSTCDESSGALVVDNLHKCSPPVPPLAVRDVF